MRVKIRTSLRKTFSAWLPKLLESETRFWPRLFRQQLLSSRDEKRQSALCHEIHLWLNMRQARLSLLKNAPQTQCSKHTAQLHEWNLPFQWLLSQAQRTGPQTPFVRKPQKSLLSLTLSSHTREVSTKRSLHPDKKKSPLPNPSSPTLLSIQLERHQVQTIGLSSERLLLPIQTTGLQQRRRFGRQIASKREREGKMLYRAHISLHSPSQIQPPSWLKTFFLLRRTRT